MSRVTLFGLLCMILTACAGVANVPLAERLSLAAEQPTFVFFYTDN